MKNEWGFNVYEKKHFFPTKIPIYNYDDKRLSIPMTTVIKNKKVPFENNLIKKISNELIYQNYLDSFLNDDYLEIRKFNQKHRNEILDQQKTYYDMKQRKIPSNYPNNPLEESISESISKFTRNRNEKKINKEILRKRELKSKHPEHDLDQYFAIPDFHPPKEFQTKYPVSQSLL